MFGEIGVSPRAYTWNDRERTATELETHIAQLRTEQSVRSDRLVLAGFSMGGLQAIAIGLTGRIAVTGIIAVAPWLPHIKEFTELARDGHAVSRRNMVNPTSKPVPSHVETCLKDTEGPVIAATDYIRSFAEQIRAYVPRRYVVLGTDGFGRSDTREKLRYFFEVDRHWVTVAALKALADEGKIPASKVAEAMTKYNLDAKKPAPWTV